MNPAIVLLSARSGVEGRPSAVIRPAPDAHAPHYRGIVYTDRFAKQQRQQQQPAPSFRARFIETRPGLAF